MFTLFVKFRVYRPGVDLFSNIDYRQNIDAFFEASLDYPITRIICISMVEFNLFDIQSAVTPHKPEVLAEAQDEVAALTTNETVAAAMQQTIAATQRPEAYAHLFDFQTIDSPTVGLLSLAIDASASMVGCEELVDTFVHQDFLECLRGSYLYRKVNPSAVVVDILSYNHEVRSLYPYAPLPNLNYDSSHYRPGGGTDILSAMMEQITSLTAMRSRGLAYNKQINMGAINFTDGEHMGGPYAVPQVRAVLEEHVYSQDGAYFAFIVSNEQGYDLAKQLGFVEGQTLFVCDSKDPAYHRQIRAAVNLASTYASTVVSQCLPVHIQPGPLA